MDPVTVTINVQAVLLVVGLILLGVVIGAVGILWLLFHDYNPFPF